MQNQSTHAKSTDVVIKDMIVILNTCLNKVLSKPESDIKTILVSQMSFELGAN